MDEGELRTAAWAERTGGALTSSQRRGCVVASLATYARHGRELALLALRVGRPDGDPDRWLPTVPDGALTAAALEACAAQGPEMEGHGLRTWLFGGALAGRDGVALDPEHLHVAAIAHDVGLATPVQGQDFTLRSADAAVAAWAAAGRPLDDAAARTTRDAIVAHTTPGLDPAVEPMGAYLQLGAMVDLVGLRLRDLPEAVVAEVYRRHPQPGFRAALVRAFDAEAEAVPRGRFALLRRLGFTLAVRTAPTRSR